MTTSNEDGLTMTYLRETDEDMDTFLMMLALGNYRACLSVHVRPTQFLCASPMGGNETMRFSVLLFC